MSDYESQKNALNSKLYGDIEKIINQFGQDGAIKFKPDMRPLRIADPEVTVERIKTKIQKLSEAAQEANNLTAHSDDGRGSEDENLLINYLPKPLQAYAKESLDKAIELQRKAPMGDIQPVENLTRALRAARTVGSFLPLDDVSPGCGAIVGPEIVMTACHTIERLHANSRDYSDIEFTLYDPLDTSRTYIYHLNPKHCLMMSEELDVALIGISGTDAQARQYLEGVHPLTLSVDEETVLPLDPVGILHCPNGGPLSVTYHDSAMLFFASQQGMALGPYARHFCVYTGDTLPGSSGGPLFTERWELLGVHRRGVHLRDNDNKVIGIDRKPIEGSILQNEDKILWVANLGVRGSAIKAWLKAHQCSDEEMDKRRKNLLNAWDNAKNSS